MKNEFAILSHVPLLPGTTFARPERSRHLPLDAPAVEVMTDFKKVFAVTVSPHVTIDDALERMKTSGVRMLLVTSETDEIIGLITAKDIQGERPVQLVRDGGLTRPEITVAHLMVPQSAIEVLTMTAVRNARVGHIMTTLHAIERQHALVVEVDKSGRKHTVRGVFSTSEIGKRVGQPVSEIMTSAHSLAELQHVLGSAR